jgi:hypothetical protein
MVNATWAQMATTMRLWAILAATSPANTTPLDGVERRKLRDEMNRWYFDEGNGILMSTPARDLWVAVACVVAAGTALREQQVGSTAAGAGVATGPTVATLPAWMTRRRGSSMAARVQSLAGGCLPGWCSA